MAVPERRVLFGGNKDSPVVPVSADGSDYWEFHVADTGTGIPENLRENVFQSFFTTKDRDQGTGLGLAIVRGIVHDHKGLLDFQSSSEGTTFKVRLLKGSG
jgi:two-component system cell cycle sensor histidine kinase/response regulator CckA